MTRFSYAIIDRHIFAIDQAESDRRSQRYSAAKLALIDCALATLPGTVAVDSLATHFARINPLGSLDGRSSLAVCICDDSRRDSLYLKRGEGSTYLTVRSPDAQNRVVAATATAAVEHYGTGDDTHGSPDAKRNHRLAAYGASDRQGALAMATALAMAGVDGTTWQAVALALGEPTVETSPALAAVVAVLDTIATDAIAAAAVDTPSATTAIERLDAEIGNCYARLAIDVAAVEATDAISATDPDAPGLAALDAAGLADRIAAAELATDAQPVKGKRSKRNRK